LQAQRRLGVIGLIGFDEKIEGLFSFFFGFGLPNVVGRGFGLWLRQLGQALCRSPGALAPQIEEKERDAKMMRLVAAKRRTHRRASIVFHISGVLFSNYLGGHKLPMTSPAGPKAIRM
jgi:hypothetical protein